MSSPQPVTARERFQRSRIGQWLEKREFVKHVLTLMTGTAFAQLLGMAVYPIVTRLFSDVDMGIFGMFSAVVTFLVTIAALRYEYAVVPAGSDDEARALIMLATRVNLTISTAATIIGALCGGLIANALASPPLAQWLWLSGPMVFVTAQVVIYTQWLNRKKYYAFASGNHMAQSLIMSGTRVGFGVPGSSVWGLIGSQFLGQLIALVRVFVKTRPELTQQRSVTLRHMARKYRRMPLMNGPNAVVDAIRLNGITLLIGMFFSLGAVGNFSVAWLLIQAPLSLINGALSQVFFQKMAVTQRGHMRQLVLRSFGRSLLLGIVPFALIYFLAPPLMPWILGEKFGLVGVISAALVPWLFMNLATSPVSMLFIVVQKQGVMLAFSVFYMLTPLAIIWFYHPSIEATMTVVSLAMAALLVGFCVLALWAARRYDQGLTPDLDDAMPDQEPSVSQGE